MTEADLELLFLQLQFEAILKIRLTLWAYFLQNVFEGNCVLSCLPLCTLNIPVLMFSVTARPPRPLKPMP